ncbi:MDR/zinc-dependent alcohol dehydrogenase-like family protein [Vibrio sp. WXL103]|uniref:MDR/zinc-dependent alcohol dehydrogenase-like family protein n=1 Tax=Vibrio sp. WXL103 TaxID=3450710 RepID=UPI003EC666B7
MELLNYSVSKSNSNNPYFIYTSVKLSDYQSLIIELLYTGVCGTDKQIVQGLRSEIATVIGHEGIGRVIQSNQLFKGFEVGDLVTFNPTDTENQDNILGHTYDGVFQKYYTIDDPVLANAVLIKVPNLLPLKAGAIIEPLAAVLYSFSLISGNRKISNIAIYGLGTLGVVYALYLSKYYPDINISLFTSSKSRLTWFSELSESNGIKLTSIDGEFDQRFDASIIATSISDTCDSLIKAIRGTKVGGIVDIISGFSENKVIAGVSSETLSSIRRKNTCGIPVDGYVEDVYFPHIDRNLSITGHRGVSREDMLRSATILEEYWDYFSKVITHELNLRQLTNQFNSLSCSGNFSLDGEVVKIAVDNQNVCSDAPYLSIKY